MITAAGTRWLILMLVAGSVFAAGTASAQYERLDAETRGMRTEVWLAVSTWPGLSELEPTVGGSFDQVGFGLGGALHWKFRETESSELMLGVEGAIMATGSDIPVLLDELYARDGYLAVSAKWLPTASRHLSLDAGLGYHLLDIAQLDTDYYYNEFQSWEEGTFGPFVGFTWDAGAGGLDDEGGMTLGFRAHFLDFGAVRDEDVLGSVILGRDAGKVDGAMYTLRIGYRWP